MLSFKTISKEDKKLPESIKAHVNMIGKCLVCQTTDERHEIASALRFACLKYNSGQVKYDG